MEGLRKLRHIDIRACFIQTEVQAGAIKVFSVKGTENPADIFTKNLDLNSTLKHMQALGLRSTLLPEGVRGLASSVLRACVVRETPNLRERFRPNSQHELSAQVAVCGILRSTVVGVCEGLCSRIPEGTRLDRDCFRRRNEEGDLRGSSRSFQGSKESRTSGFPLEFNSMHRRVCLPETEPQQVRNGVPEAS